MKQIKFGFAQPEATNLQTQLDGFGNDVYEMQKSAINNIRNIISKAKGGEF